MISIETLSEKLKNQYLDDLPGKSAQNVMLAQPRSNEYFSNLEEHAIPSAVLILLYPQGEEIHFILTERTNDVQHHKGQISLPGGSWDDGEQLHDTAFRETEEEIGIPSDSINLICELTPLHVKVTGYMIHPFVGYLKHLPKIVPNANEVKKVFSPTLSELLNPDNQKLELWTIRQIMVDVPFFKFGKHKVWGATAMILSEFKQCLLGVL